MQEHEMRILKTFAIAGLLSRAAMIPAFAMDDAAMQDGGMMMMDHMMMK